MAEVEVQQGKWLGVGGGRRRKRELHFLAEVRHYIVKMEMPGEVTIISGEFWDVTNF